MADVIGIGAATEPPVEPFRVAFQLTGDPVPKARPRVTRNGTFTPKKVRQYEDAIAHAGKVAMKWAQPVHMALVVTVEAFLPIPGSWSAKRRQSASAGVIAPKGRVGDLDNFAKTIMDGLNGIVWNDDCQIVKLVITKRYSDHPRMQVCVNEWTNEKEKNKTCL